MTIRSFPSKPFLFVSYALHIDCFSTESPPSDFYEEPSEPPPLDFMAKIPGYEGITYDNGKSRLMSFVDERKKHFNLTSSYCDDESTKQG